MKKIFCVFLIAVLLITTAVCADDTTVNIGVGDYFLFGTYGGSEILWRCVDVDSNGVLLMTHRIICEKPFDAEGTTGSHQRGVLRNSGSNYWEDSNIRSWLNSDKEAGQVVWLCGNAPTSQNVTENPYDNEAGFLYGFSEDEKSLMKEVTQKSLLDQYEYSDMSPYGTAPHTRKTAIADVIQNYDTAYSHNVTDKVFLLDVKQIKAVYDNRAILGNSYHIAKDSNGDEIRSWLRSPRASSANSFNTRCVTTTGTIDNFNTPRGDIGVRPAFYLKETALIDTGSGSLADPYTVVAPAFSSGAVQLSGTLPMYSGESTAWVVTTVRNPSGLITAVNLNDVTLSPTSTTDVTITVSDTEFTAGHYFDIYVWDTELVPVMAGEHYQITYVDGTPTLLPVA